MVTNRSVVLCYSKVKGVALRDALLGCNNNYLRTKNDADLSSVEGLFRPSTLSLYFDKPLILINRQLDKQTKQMVCGYALGHYLEHQLLMDLHTLDKFLTIKDKHILLYEHNAFTSHLMLDSDEVYQMTKRGLDAAQISASKRIHLNLVLVKLLELHHLGYDLRHYHAQHHAFIKQFNLPAHFQFDVAAG